MSSTSLSTTTEDPPGPLTIAAQVKGAREGLSLTQRQLAKACEIAQKQISHAESGYEVTLKTLIQIATGLKKAGSTAVLHVYPDVEWPRPKPWGSKPTPEGPRRPKKKATSSKSTTRPK